MGADPGPLTPDDPGRPEIAALADGRWSAWRGLADATSLADVEAQLGPGVDARARGGMFGGSPTMFRRWDARAGAPKGLTVWSEGDVVVGIEIPEAVRDADDADLPPADADLESGITSHHRQRVWASRGLVVHVSDVPAGQRVQAATQLFGLAPFTLRDWEDDPLRLWGRTRLPRR